MKGSKIAPWITIFAGLLWIYAAVSISEYRTLSIILSIVFLLFGLLQLKINSMRFKEDKTAASDEEVS